MAVCDPEHGVVRVYLGERTGGLALIGDYRLASPSGAVAADLDGDGMLDLAIASVSTATIAILIGSGDGRFRLRDRYRVRSAEHLQAVANGRGSVDLVLGRPGRFQVLSGRGDGSFRYEAVTSPIGGEAGQELTPRERQAAELAAHGFRAREIAARMGIGVRTVETHLERVRSKLGGVSKSELVRMPLLNRHASVPGTDDTPVLTA